MGGTVYSSTSGTVWSSVLTLFVGDFEALDDSGLDGPEILFRHSAAFGKLVPCPDGVLQ